MNDFNHENMYRKKDIHTTPPIQSKTANNLDNVNLSPLADGNIAARTNVKKLDVELNSVTMAVSFGSNAN